MWTLRDLFMFLSPAYKQEQMAKQQRQRELQGMAYQLPPQDPRFINQAGPNSLATLMWNDPRYSEFMRTNQDQYLKRIFDTPRFMRPGEESQFMTTVPWRNYYGF